MRRCWDGRKMMLVIRPLKAGVILSTVEMPTRTIKRTRWVSCGWRCKGPRVKMDDEFSLKMSGTTVSMIQVILSFTIFGRFSVQNHRIPNRVFITRKHSSNKSQLSLFGQIDLELFSTCNRKWTASKNWSAHLLFKQRHRRVLQESSRTCQRHIWNILQTVYNFFWVRLPCWPYLFALILLHIGPVSPLLFAGIISA